MLMTVIIHSNDKNKKLIPMKHLVHEVHHPHLKKRAILEFVGLGILVTILVSQRTVIISAIETVSEVEAIWFVLLLALYWLLLPLTALSYKLITPKPKKLRLKTTILAHLAGAGPGRIIPGGIGNISIGALHMNKNGLSIEQGIGVVVTNNAIGFAANIVLIIGALFIRPETLNILTDNISSYHITIGAGAIIAIVVLFQWLIHARSTHKEAAKTAKQWRKIIVGLLRQPKKVCGVLLIAFMIANMHTLLLLISGAALGSGLTYVDALIALSFGVAIGGILPTPGGIGGVEAGTTATLIVLGYDEATAISIAVLFRVATYWQPLIPGTLAYLYLRERKLL
jgi:uncharacterized membrane protein YbhN (UPF0104 family)